MRWIVFYLTIVSCLSPAITVTLEPGPDIGCDTTLKQQYPTGNFGLANSIVADPASGIQQVFLIKFDLTPYSCSTVIQAHMELYVVSGVGSGSLVANRVTGSWGEMTATWNNAPSYDSTDYSANLSAPGNWTIISIPEMTQIWLSHPELNFGVRCKIPQSGVNRAFRSSDGVYGPERPKFILEYQPNIAVEPTSLGDIKTLFRTS